MWGLNLAWDSQHAYMGISQLSTNPWPYHSIKLNLSCIVLKKTQKIAKSIFIGKKKTLQITHLIFINGNAFSFTVLILWLYQCLARKQ